MVAVVGLFGNKGGKDLEAGFIADALSQKVNVDILSLQTGKDISDLRVHFTRKIVFVDERVSKSSIQFKFYSLLNKIGRQLGFIRSEQFLGGVFRRRIDLDDERYNVLKKLLSNYDSLVFVGSPGTSTFTEILGNKDINPDQKVFFRVTSNVRQLENYTKLEVWTSEVQTFIMHSELNANALRDRFNISYKIIDQCAFQEDDLLKIGTLNRLVKNFYILSRIDYDKNIEQVIDAFQALNIRDIHLHIIGSGDNYYDDFYNTYESLPFITLHGHKDQKELSSFLSTMDCLIVTNTRGGEAGPLNAIETLCAGRLLVSPRLGAMPERMADHFKFYSSQSELQEEILKLNNLTTENVVELSSQNRELYLKNYRREKISTQYQKLILHNI